MEETLNGVPLSGSCLRRNDDRGRAEMTMGDGVGRKYEVVQLDIIQAGDILYSRIANNN